MNQTGNLLVTNLPEGWAETSIKDLFAFKYGKGLIQEKRKASGGKPVYGSNGIVGEHDQTITKGPAIIVGRKGSVGEVHFSPVKCWPIDTTYFIDEFPEGSPPEYWALYLRSLRLGQQEKSSAIPGISRQDIYKLPVAVPPVNEQFRIVGKLEELLGKVDACQNRLARIPAILKRFRQSVLAAACSGVLTADWRVEQDVAEDLEHTTIEEIAEYVGGFAYKSVTFVGTGTHQVVRIGNVKPLALNLIASPIFVPKNIVTETQRFRLQPNDLVISMTGTKYKRDYGNAAIVKESDGSLYVNQRVARLRCKEKVLPKFLLYWLQTDFFRQFFFAGETGNVNQGNVGADGIREAPIDLPSLAEQHEIVRRVEGLFALADQIKARHQKAQAHVDKLTQSILAKAFRGELVPTEAELARREGRDYEPTSVPRERMPRRQESQLNVNKTISRPECDSVDDAPA